MGYGVEGLRSIGALRPNRGSPANLVQVIADKGLAFWSESLSVEQHAHLLIVVLAVGWYGDGGGVSGI